MTRKAPSSRNPASAKAPWGWAAFGATVGTLGVLCLFAPAKWLADGLQSATAGHVQLQQAHGTLWNGSALLVLTGGAGSTDQAALPGRIHWQLRPNWLGASIRVNADCCTTAATPLHARALLQWGGASIQVNDATSQWPAEFVNGLGTPWNTIQPQGRLALKTQSLNLSWSSGRMNMSGQAQLDAIGVSSRLSTLRPMGSYRVLVQGGDSPTLTLSTLDGALLLSGSGQWVGQRLRFTGEASAAPGSEAALANLMNIIGRRTGDRSIITVG